MGFIKSSINLGLKIADARTIKKDPEKRKKCKIFGISSIVYSILMVAMAALTMVFPLWLHSDNFVLLIVGIILGAVGFISTITFFVNSLIRFILQISINRKAITWIAMVVLIIAIAASVFLILRTMSMF